MIIKETMNDEEEERGEYLIELFIHYITTTNNKESRYIILYIIQYYLYKV